MNVFNGPIQHETQRATVLLDSGEFSRWFSGKKINFDAYLEYVRTVKDEVHAAINLDVIPGAPRKDSMPYEMRRACRQSFDRWHQLRKTGALVLPVYHQTDSLDWLQRYIDAGAEYIGISPTHAENTDSRMRWLLDTHLLLDRWCNGRLGSGVYTHALGVFSPTFLPRLKGLAWSADATTIVTATFRRLLYLPVDINDEITLGAFARLRRVYVGRRKELPENNKVNWTDVRNYLRAIDLEYSYSNFRDRITLDVAGLTSANVYVARRVQAQAGVRCFIAGSDRRVLRQLVNSDKYPYILKTYAEITERDGTTIRNVVNRLMPGRKGRPHQNKQAAV